MKVGYTDKTNDPAAPETNRKFSATDANELKNAINNNDRSIISHTNVVTLNKDYISEHIIDGPINYVFSNTLTPVLGSQRVDYLIADGINKPTFDVANFVVRFDNYKNEVNQIHRVFLEYIGNNKILVELVYV